MAYDGMHGHTDDMRTAAGSITAAKPVVPPWTGTPVQGNLMNGVKAVSTAVNDAVLRGQGFGKSAAEGFDLFSQIIHLCASEYDQSDAAGAAEIARAAAATPFQTDRVDFLNRGGQYDRDYYDYLRQHGRPEDFEGFTFPGDGRPPEPAANTEEGN
jgi:hypothetical protein